MTSKRWTSGEILTNEDLNTLAGIADDALAATDALSGQADLIQADADAASAAAAAAQATADAAVTNANTRALKSNNLSDLASAAAARTNLGLHAAAASGDFYDLENAPIDRTDTDDGRQYWVDPAGRVVASIGGDRWEMTGITLVAGGASSIDDLAVTTLRFGATVATAGDGTGQHVLDPAGRALHSIDRFGTHVPGMTIASGDGTGGLLVQDRGGRVIAEIDSTAGVAGWGGEDTTTHTQAEIDRRHAENLAAVAALAVSPTTNLARPVWGRSHFLSYGQSLSIGSEGTPVLSTSAVAGTYMYGDKIRPTTNNSATATWDRVGASAFNAMVTTGDAEVPIAGALRLFRRLWLDWRGVAADSSIGFVASSCGIGGQAIAALAKGASPEIYARFTSCISQAKAQATSDGQSYGVAGVLWLQGESNQSTATATYKSAMLDLVDDMLADAVAGTGQARVPGFFTYQTAMNPNFDTNNGGPAQAQLELAQEDPRITMVGPIYQLPDSSNLHLVANPYRWLGAYFAKAMHRVINLGQRFLPLHMRRATRRGREILIDFHVPVPPLVWEDPWLQSGFSGSYGGSPLAQTNTQYAVPDKGFVIRNMTTAANLDIDTITLLETQVLIQLAAEPASTDTIAVRYAPGATYGHGSLRDSDPTTADDVWEHVTSRTDADTNATLLGEPYPLPNWAAAQHLEVT